MPRQEASGPAGREWAILTIPGHKGRSQVRSVRRPWPADRGLAWLPRLACLAIMVCTLVPAALVVAIPWRPQTAESATLPPWIDPDPNALHANSVAGNTPADDDRRSILLSFRFLRVRSDLQPDQETLFRLVNLRTEGRSGVPIMRPYGWQPDMTIADAFNMYVIPQSWPHQTGQNLTELLQSGGYLTVLGDARVLAKDGLPASIHTILGGHPWTDPRSRSEPSPARYGMAVHVTPRLLERNGISLEMKVVPTDPWPGPEDGSQAPVLQAGKEITRTTWNDDYVMWAVVESIAGQGTKDKGPESLYIMVKPNIEARVPNESSVPAALTSGSPRHVLLDVRKVTMDGNDLAGLKMEWASPATKAGQFPDASAGGITGNSGAGTPLWSPRIGYAPDQTFTESLTGTLEHLRRNHHAEVLGEQILTRDGHPARSETLLDWRFTALVPAPWNSAQQPGDKDRQPSVSGKQVRARDGHPAWVETLADWGIRIPVLAAPNSAQQPAERYRIGDLALKVTPHIGESNDIILDVAVDLSEFVPKVRGSDLPLVRRRIINYTVALKDGGTVAVAGMMRDGYGWSGKEVREAAIFVTATCIGDTAEAPLRAPRTP
jgi:hypothetical protein